MSITHEHVQHLARRGENLHKRLEKLREKLSGVTARAVRTLEVGTGALLGGVVTGHAGPDGGKIAHVPIDLGAGLILNLLGYFDAAGDEYSPHLNNFGDGFLASYLSSLGFGIGNNKRTTGTWFPPKQVAAGAAGGAIASGEVSPAQMAAILDRVQAARQ